MGVGVGRRVGTSDSLNRGRSIRIPGLPRNFLFFFSFSFLFEFILMNVF